MSAWRTAPAACHAATRIGFHARPASYRPRPDSEAYARYEKAMHEWATRLGVRLEVIEYYLLTEAGEPGSPLWAECVAQHTCTSRNELLLLIRLASAGRSWIVSSKVLRVTHSR